MFTGESKQVVCTVFPENATNKNVTWLSSNPNVLSVDNNGNIKGISLGTVDVRATSVDGNNIATCSVTVRAPSIDITQINLTSQNISIDKNVRMQLTYTFLPENATNKSLVWSSSNTTVATVDSVGNVTGLASGTAEISVKTSYGNITAKCSVTVKESGVSVTGVTINGSQKSYLTISSRFSEIVRLNGQVLPSNATNQKIIWSSKNTSIALVTNDGQVEGGYTAGTTTIVAESVDGSFRAECQVTVKDINVTGIWAHPNYITLNMGMSYTGIAIDFTPANASNKNVTYTSLDSNIATVDNYGKITAKGIGKVDIIIKSEDGGYESAVTVTVIN